MLEHVILAIEALAALSCLIYALKFLGAKAEIPRTKGPDIIKLVSIFFLIVSVYILIFYYEFLFEKREVTIWICLKSLLNIFLLTLYSRTTKKELKKMKEGKKDTNNS